MDAVSTTSASPAPSAAIRHSSARTSIALLILTQGLDDPPPHGETQLTTSEVMFAHMSDTIDSTLAEERRAQTRAGNSRPDDGDGTRGRGQRMRRLGRRSQRWWPEQHQRADGQQP